MSEKNHGTMSATTNENSILNTSLSSPLLEEKEILLPYTNILPLGNYSSEIVSVSEIGEQSPCIDCVHRLTDNQDQTYWVKFRFFAPKDTAALAKKMIEYGFSGTFGDAWVGLCETVSIEQRPGSTKYVFIANRTLCENVSCSSQKKAEHASLSRKGRTLHQAPSRLEKERQALLSEEEDTEFDDFLPEEDE